MIDIRRFSSGIFGLILILSLFGLMRQNCSAPMEN